MKRDIIKTIFLLIVLICLNAVVQEHDAFARAGGGGSFGSRGSRSYSAPSPAPSRQLSPQSPAQSAPQQQPGGGFLRGLGGGILGGLLGGMLFNSMGFGGGGGFGIFPIVLVLGLGYLLYRMVAKRKAEESPDVQTSYTRGGYQSEPPASYESDESAGASSKGEPTVIEGLSYIRQMDPSFDDGRFKDLAMDIFFRIQGASMNRNVSPVGSLLTDEVKNVLQQDIDRLVSEKRVNRLENIAVRTVEISEIWQESGRDFITVLFTASLLDYTTDEVTGEVVAGSKTEPVKFEEFWTFTRSVGNNPWKLSAINQV